MGLLEVIRTAFERKSGEGDGRLRQGPAQKCPNCGEPITLGMERCPKCGTHIQTMFRRKCPKCQALNGLDEKRCTQCKYDFEAELERAKKTYYTCPICNYKSEALLTRCPACNTQFI